MVMPNNEEELEEGRAEIMPARPIEPEPEPPPEEEPESDYPDADLSDQDMDDLFGVGGVTGMSEPDDLSDLVEVDEEDIFGLNEAEPQPKPQPKKLYYRRTSQPYYPPETGMGGVRH